MSNADGRLIVAVATVGAIAGSVACALLLHGAASRADASGLVVVTTLWGLFSVAIASRITLQWVPALLAAALLVRIPLVGTPPLLSDDLFRYLFEGIAMNHGHNPFVVPPASLEGLADPIRTQVNHPHVTTIYPPLALWWFRVLGVFGHVWTTQLATALVDAATPVALLLATRKAWPAWVYALHPLPVLESAVGAHVDIPAVAVAAWGVAAWRQGSIAGAWWGLLGGAALKLLPAVALPVVWWQSPRKGWLLILSTGALLLLAVPVLDAGPSLLDGFRQYAGRWSFNGFVFTWVSDWHGARTGLVMVGASITAFTVMRVRDPGAVWAVVGAAFVLLSPTVHPWYVLWALVPSLLQARLGWSLAAVPMLAGYTVLASFDPATGSWGDPWWVWWLTWPFAIPLLLFGRWVVDTEPRA